MLVVVSDLHLTDGTAAPTLHPGAVHLFIQQMQDLAERAGWRAAGNYQPIDRIDLVLLGDALDIINSQRWLASDIRPWTTPATQEMSQAVADIVDDILRQNQVSMHLLRALASDEILSVSAADSKGKAIPGQSVPVSVRTHYLVGNRDWPLHLRGNSFDLIRQRIAHHMGLANAHSAPFPHDASESEELQETLRRHRVFARHGDIFDPLAFSGDRDLASVSDAIVIELMGTFLQELQASIGDSLPASVMQQLADMHQIRPILLAPVYLDGLLQRVCTTPGQRKQIQKIWDTHVDRLLALPIIRQHDAANAMDLVDGLDRALSFRRRVAIGWADQSRKWMQELRGASSDSYLQHAISEQDFRNRRARHIVYGHTHHAEQIPLDASHADGFVLNQMYFNSGTWRRVFRPTHILGGEHEFIGAEALSLLAFYQADERAGRAFETMSGTLGTTTNSVPLRPLERSTRRDTSLNVAQTVPPRMPHMIRRGSAPISNETANY